MQIGMIGLGRMGGNLARRLMQHGHEAVVYDAQADAVRQLAAEGAVAALDLAQLVARLARPRAVWVMLPAGEATARTIAALEEVLAPGDTVIDGGNSHFHDDVRHAAQLAARGIRYLDVGTSGGVWGLERGYCLMIGGDRSAAEDLDPIFRALAPGLGSAERTPGRESGTRAGSTAEQGYLYTGPAGSGHFVKMIHNGIEYGMMQAFAEGMDILRGAGGDSVPPERRYALDLADVAEVWRRGSVVSSWLLDLTAIALAEDPHLERYSGHVSDSGEGRWTVHAAIEEAVPAPVLTSALYARFRSRQAASYADKLLSAMREQFGGHREPPKHKA